ncbi:MAG: chemotaxis protein CheX [Phycisphaerales bacterium]|nr:MAG: chemotaxis protein CheX [Phycisphaerales bacterium]
MMVDEVCLNEALLAGATEVFETMIFMDVRASDEKEQHPKGNTLLGSITFTGEMEGCLGICCSVSCAKAIAQNMLGLTKAEELDEAEITDAIGEVANMVMGSVKSRIQETVGNLNVSIPTVVRGRSLDNSLGDHPNPTRKTLMRLNIADEYTAELSLWHRQS